MTVYERGGLTFPKTRSSVGGSGFKVSALVTMTLEAFDKIRVIKRVELVLVGTYIELGEGFGVVW